MRQEVERRRSFGYPDGNIRDLSFLDAYQAAYVQHHEGKEPLEYRSWIIYSLHRFIKDYEYQTNEEKQSLMYHALKEFRPFCQHRYNLVHIRLKRTILALPESNVTHAGYDNYAVIEVDLDGGDRAFYFVAFGIFRGRKKFRLHVTNAYPASGKQEGKSVKFFTIAYSLLRNKQLPQPSK